MIGAQCEAGVGVSATFDHIDLSNGAAELFLSAGLVPPPGGLLETAIIDAILDGECPNVTSTRSMPAQVAVALSPEGFLTSSMTGFVGADEKSKRRRSEAINHLRRAGSEYSQIARQRAFKVGQKGSTFPWAETAAALHGHVGHRWLASEIAIIGAASPFPLGYTKKTDSTPFGATSHPSELLAQARSNGQDLKWWRTQLDALDDDLSRTEWALALWCVASGAVIAELWSEFETLLSQLPTARRDTVLRAAEMIARYGWLIKRPVAVATDDPVLIALNNCRTSASSVGEQEVEASAPWDSSTPAFSLLSVAREEKWMKVDARPTYR